ncbi:hypothetical protein Zmor_012270 [Zophobas morio]|uniref:Uncharacterized protein n=1 Tax=Zophobas morio TaxID=2755281 RepID=A0AA38HH23_9CUCU|nr:hypothetical protein Zmor_012270 [Zophobas morio]
MRVVAMPTVDQQIRYIEALLNDGRADNRFTVNFDSRNFPEYLVYLEEFITSRFGTNENLPIKIEMEMKDNLLNRKKQLIVYINANNSRAALHSTMYQMDRKLDYSDIVNHDVNFIEETNDIKFTDHDDYKKVDVTKKVEPIVTKDQIYAVDDKHIIFKAQGAGDLIGLNIFPTGKPSSKGIKKIKIENDVIDVTLNDSISDSQSITIEAMNMNKTLVVSCKLDSNHNYTEPETSVNELELTVGE